MLITITITVSMHSPEHPDSVGGEGGLPDVPGDGAAEEGGQLRPAEVRHQHRHLYSAQYSTVHDIILQYSTVQCAHLRHTRTGAEPRHGRHHGRQHQPRHPELNIRH